MRHPNTIIGIDPSMRSLGLAAITSSHLEPLALRLCTLIQISSPGDSDATYVARSIEMASAVVTEVVALGRANVAVAIEVPANWGNERGRDSKNSESIQRLYLTVGAILKGLYDLECVCEVWGTHPTWKGQATKDIMIHRACKLLEQSRPLLPTLTLTSDAAEAYLLARRFREDWQAGRLVDRWMHIADINAPVNVGNITATDHLHTS